MIVARQNVRHFGSRGAPSTASVSFTNVRPSSTGDRGEQLETIVQLPPSPPILERAQKKAAGTGRRVNCIVVGREALLSPDGPVYFP
jgi:hypothetical protein